MIGKKPLLFFLLLLCGFYCFGQNPTLELPSNITFWSDYPHDVLADALVQRMTNGELLAQILMFGWSGAEPTPLLLQWVEQRSLGSVKVFGWQTDDCEAVARAVGLVQEKAQNGRFQIPLYVATDQEGGWIRHIKGATSDTPGNLAIGASGYPMDAYYSGYYIGQELRAMGVNMNFAPTVDLYSNPQSTVIGPRSFGSDPDYGGVLSASYSAGSMDAGVIPTAKHFPGHGDTEADSHGKLPVIDISMETLKERELVPFRYLIAEKIPAIMSAHLSFPQIEPSGEPASLSKTFLTDLLRNELGYQGLIITDDMMMNGATMYAGALSTAVRMAIEAGNDIVISSTTAQLNEALWTRNLSLMDTDPDFFDNVKKAARRVIFSKLEYFKGENSVPLYPDVTKVRELVPAPGAKEFFTAQACRSITLHHSDSFPYTPEEASNEQILVAAQFQEFFDEAHYKYENTSYYFFGYTLGPNELAWHGERLASMAKNYDTVILCVANEESSKIAAYLKDIGKKVILVSIMAPSFVLEYDWANTVLMAYSYSPYSFAAAFSALAGEYVPEGILPMDIANKEIK